MLLFREIQSFRTTWYSLLILAITLGVLGLVTFGIYQQIGMGKPFGDNPASDGGLIAISVLMIIINGVIGWLVWAGTLRTEIDNRNIKVCFFPFHSKEVVTPWSKVRSAEIAKFRPLIDFGGYGLRWIKNGTVYNVRGKYALDLTLENGKHLVIGTQKPEEMEKILAQLQNS